MFGCNNEKLHLEPDIFTVLLEQIDEEVLITDSDGVILLVNSKVAALWGGCAEEYIGKHCLSLLTARPHDDAGQSIIDAALRSDEKIMERYTAIGPDGKAKHYLVRAFPFRASGTAARRVVMTRRDMTGEAELLQQLQVSQKMAVIGEMAAFVSHEIRNPLLSIGGFAASLSRQDDLSEETKKKALIIQQEAKRLEKILHTITRYAKPTELREHCVDVNTAAKQARDILMLNPKNQKPEIRLELSPSGHMVRADKDKLVQCLINLITNAREAVAGKKGLVVVKTRYADATVYLEVEDNGSGIPESQQDAVFTPYMTTKGKGSGLGLAITRKLVTEMGGRMFLHSKENIGTLLSIALPPALDLEEEVVGSVKSALV